MRQRTERADRSEDVLQCEMSQFEQNRMKSVNMRDEKEIYKHISNKDHKRLG